MLGGDLLFFYIAKLQISHTTTPRDEVAKTKHHPKWRTLQENWTTKRRGKMWSVPWPAQSRIRTTTTPVTRSRIGVAQQRRARVLSLRQATGQARLCRYLCWYQLFITKFSNVAKTPDVQLQRACSLGCTKRQWTTKIFLDAFELYAMKYRELHKSAFFGNTCKMSLYVQQSYNFWKSTFEMVFKNSPICFSTCSAISQKMMDKTHHYRNH